MSSSQKEITPVLLFGTNISEGVSNTGINKRPLGGDKGAFTPQSSGLTIYIRGLDTSKGIDEIQSSLKKHFATCGEISKVYISTDYDTGAAKGSAFIEFSDPQAFNKALEMNGAKFGDSTLTVEEAHGRRGFGGGGNKTEGKRSVSGRDKKVEESSLAGGKKNVEKSSVCARKKNVVESSAGGGGGKNVGGKNSLDGKSSAGGGGGKISLDVNDGRSSAGGGGGKNVGGKNSLDVNDGKSSAGGGGVKNVGGKNSLDVNDGKSSAGGGGGKISLDANDGKSSAGCGGGKNVGGKIGLDVNDGKSSAGGGGVKNVGGKKSVVGGGEVNVGAGKENVVESTSGGVEKNVVESPVVGGGDENTGESSLGGVEKNVVESSVVGGRDETVEESSVGAGKKNVVEGTSGGGKNVSQDTGYVSVECCLCEKWRIVQGKREDYAKKYWVCEHSPYNGRCARKETSPRALGLRYVPDPSASTSSNPTNTKEARLDGRRPAAASTRPPKASVSSRSTVNVPAPPMKRTASAATKEKKSRPPTLPPVGCTSAPQSVVPATVKAMLRTLNAAEVQHRKNYKEAMEKFARNNEATESIFANMKNQITGLLPE